MNNTLKKATQRIYGSRSAATGVRVRVLAGGAASRTRSVE